MEVFLIFVFLQATLAILSIWDLFLHNLPAKIGWILVALFLPFGPLLYIILRVTAFKNFGGFLENPHEEAIPYTAVSEPITYQPTVTGGVAADPLPVPLPPPAYQGELTQPRSIFKIIGIVLATITIIAGLAFVGIVIFVVIALSSYGSNK